MKKRMLLFAIIAFILIACFDPDGSNPYNINDNLDKITIDQGIAGTVIYSEGNFMPIVVSGPNDDLSDNDLGTSMIYTGTVQLYEYTTSFDVTYSDTSNVFIDSISTTLIAETETDSLGFYQINVANTGQYSIFFIYKGKHYVEYWGSGHSINPIEILKDSVLIHNIDINHNTCW